jgi:hypothetical protein
VLDLQLGERVLDLGEQHRSRRLDPGVRVRHRRRVRTRGGA